MALTYTTLRIMTTPQPASRADLEAAVVYLAKRVAEVERINDIQARQLQGYREAARQQAERIADTWNAEADKPEDFRQSMEL